MLYLQKYDVNTWISGAYNKYYNSAFSCDSFSRIEFSTPISGTLNVTITNNTENSISNTISETISTSSNTPYLIQYTSNNWQIFHYATTWYVRYFNVTEGTSYTFVDNNSYTSSKNKNYGFTTTTTWPATGHYTILEGGGGSFTSRKTVTAPITGRCYISYAPTTNETSNPNLTITSTTYNLQLDAINSNNNSTRINVDLGTTILYPNDSVTIPITFPNDTVRLYAYVGGIPLADFPQTSIPYTGWAKNQDKDIIHESYSNHWM